MGDIDVGAPCVDGVYDLDAGLAGVSNFNAANGSGTIDAVSVYTGSSLIGFEVASFSMSGDFATTNGTAVIGATGIGECNLSAPGDFTAFAINSGEFIGCHFTSGTVDMGGLTDGIWITDEDIIPCSGKGTLLTDYKLALYAAGITGGGGAMSNIVRPVTKKVTKEVTNAAF